MSNDAIQPVDEISASSKEIDEWVVNIEARLDNNNEEIPSIIGNWKCWDDFGVSFLPETKKRKYVVYMKQWCGLNVFSYLDHMHDKKDDVWSYYEGVDERFRVENGANFIEHLLANSCFLIFAMVILTKKERLCKLLGAIISKSDDPKDQRSIEFQNLIPFILRDQMSTQQYMLTMEHQIPWFVVEAVYTKHSKLSKLFDTPIHKLALSCLKDIYPRMHKSKVNDDIITLPSGGIKHLLHIFHWSRSPQGKFHLNWDSWPSKMMDNFYIPSATDLQLSQTVFKRHAYGSIDVSYCEKGLSGVMQLAPWHLFKYSIKIYESLLKFERRYWYCGLPFTAYVACMVCLLQTEGDVRLLRANGIIPSTRNDENDVLDFVKKFKTLLHDNAIMTNDLDNLVEKVMAHHERKSTRCYGEFKSRYCSNPWITISVIAGILLFVLTFIQTLYGTLSYYKQ